MKSLPRIYFALSGLMLQIFLVACSASQQQSEFISLSTLFKDRAADVLLKAEKFEEARDLYITMLEDQPNEARLHSNIGVLLSQMQKPEDAVRSLEHALKLAEEKKDILAQFAIHFNLGAYFGAQKKIAEALQHYQAALDINPTSKEAKTNIELLLQNQNQDGKGGEQNKKDQSEDQKDQNQKDKKDQKGDQDQKDKKDQDNDKDQNKDEKKEKEKPSEHQSSAKYKPRPYQGEQLSEGDVKKILGELRNQEQKIRANFDKKEKKESRHEKDW